MIQSTYHLLCRRALLGAACGLVLLLPSLLHAQPVNPACSTQVSAAVTADICDILGLATNPDFDPSIYSYAYTLPPNLSSLNLTIRARSPLVAIKANGREVQSYVSFNLPLTLGTNTLNIDTRSDDGQTTKRYVITLIVPPAQAQYLQIPVLQFPIPSANAEPVAITAGPDGNMWFTERGAAKVGKITPDGTITEYPVRPNLGLGAITGGADGKVWFVATTASLIASMSADGTVSEFPLRVSNAEPNDIALGGNGVIYFSQNGPGSIAHFDQNGILIEYPATAGQHGIGGIATGGAGSSGVYYSETLHDKIGAVNGTGIATSLYSTGAQSAPTLIIPNPIGGVTALLPGINAAGSFPLPSANAQPKGLAYDAYGKLWVTEYATGRLARNVDSKLVEVQLPTTAAQGEGGIGPYAIARGPDGNMWVTGYKSNSIFKVIMQPKPLLLRAADNKKLLGATLVNNTLQFAELADPGPSFRLLAFADFDNDGKPDLIFQNITQGEKGDVLMWSNQNPATQRVLRDAKLAWIVEGVGDLDGDGWNDLVFRFTGDSGNPNDTGVSYIWFMQNGVVKQVRKRGGAPLSWKMLGAVDANSDGAAEMVYLAPNNSMRVLTATPNRTCANLSGDTFPAGLKLLKLGRFAGPAASILAVDNIGQVSLYALTSYGVPLPDPTADPDDPNASCTATLMTTRLGQPSYGWPSVDAGTQFYAAADLNGDGITDIIWRKSDGHLSVWLMPFDGALPIRIDDAGVAPDGYVVALP